VTAWVVRCFVEHQVCQLLLPLLQNNDTSFEEAMATHKPTIMFTGATNPMMAYRFLQWDGMQDLQVGRGAR
jgi:hypothetical protein